MHQWWRVLGRTFLNAPIMDLLVSDDALWCSSHALQLLRELPLETRDLLAVQQSTA
ncbi:hypothetical protein AAHE18_04G137800 [Arachis hypogaea]